MKFHFRMDSEWKHKSEPQEQMIDAIKRTRPRNGLIVAPCATGKTAVMVEDAIDNYLFAIFLCPTAQGVFQLAQAFREHTTMMMDTQICVYCGSKKFLPKPPFGYLITTYAMFTDSKSLRSKASRDARDYVLSQKWQAIYCDEAQHIPADTYMDLIKRLLKNSGGRGLGFTATPFRNEYCMSKSREEHEHEAFGWFGPVLFRISCIELERAGLIAKIRRARVNVELTEEFRKAYELTSGADKMYIASLNPCKLNLVSAICATHKALGQAGIVFVTHLLTARVVSKMLGPQWEVMSGGSAHGEDQTHTPERNNDIVQRFNAGGLDGLVCTQVGYSSMDVYRESCCYLVVVEADGGIASAAQRLGRVARSKRIAQLDSESEDALRERRLKCQKVAKYYDLVTCGTEDEAAAERRQRLFAVEGYGEETIIAPETLLGVAAALGAPVPYSTPVEQVLLLKEVLQYRALANVCAAANAAASKAKAPHASKVRELANKGETAKTGVMKALHKQREKRARVEKQAAAAKAKEARRDTIDNAPLSEETVATLQALSLPMSVLDEAGLVEMVYPPSDAEED